MLLVWGPHLGNYSSDFSVAQKPALLILHPAAQRELARVPLCPLARGPTLLMTLAVIGADQACPVSGPACLSPPVLRVAPSGLARLPWCFEWLPQVPPQTPPSSLWHHFI